MWNGVEKVASAGAHGRSAASHWAAGGSARHPKLSTGLQHIDWMMPAPVSGCTSCPRSCEHMFRKERWSEGVLEIEHLCQEGW